MAPLHNYGLIMSTVVACMTLVLVSSGSPVSISDGEALKGYLCSSNGTISPNTHLIITVPTLHLPMSVVEFCLVENTTNITIEASEELISTTVSYVSVECDKHTGFAFFNVTNLTIRSVSFKNCENLVPSFALRYVNDSEEMIYCDGDAQASLIFNHCYNLTLYSVLAAFSNVNVVSQNVAAYDIIGVNLCGFNNVSAVMPDPDRHPDVTALILYVGTSIMDASSECYLNVTSNIFITESKILEGRDLNFLYNDHYVAYDGLRMFALQGSSLALVFVQSEFKVLMDINVKPRPLLERDDLKVMNIFVMFMDVLVLPKVTFQGYPYETCTSGYSGGLMPVLFSSVFFVNLTSSFTSIDSNGLLLIHDTAFTNDLHSVITYDITTVQVAIMLSTSSGPNNYPVALERVSFCKSPLISQPISSLLVSADSVAMTDIYIHDYHSSEYSANAVLADHLMRFYGGNILLTGRNIFNSSGGRAAIYVYDGNITISGNLTIINANSYASNCIRLESNSMLTLLEPLEAIFDNRRASQGSALFAGMTVDVDNFNITEINSVQIKPIEDLDKLGNIDISLHFKDSSSSGANTQVYAPQLCFLFDQHALFNRTTWDPVHSQYAYTTLIDSLFKEISDYDKYTSLSNGLCLQVHGQPPWKCHYIDLLYYTNINSINNINQTYLENIDVYPGGVAFSVPVLDSEISDFYYDIDGFSSSKCFSPIRLRKGSVMLHKIYACTKNKSHSLPIQTSVRFTMIAGISIPCPIVQLNIHTACPSGFRLAEDHSCLCQCVCANALHDRGYTCDISTKLFKAPAKHWTGLEERNGSDTILFGKHCPPHYCNFKLDFFPLNDSLAHLACLNNRSGTLCGECRKNYSAVFGSDACYTHCSNLYLLTLPVYALAGLLLVLLLFALRLTVAAGTINGGIFYANILGLVMDVLTDDEEGLYLKIIRIVVSLLNLNLGFPLCLYDGMTPTAAIGFRFIFPVYLWSLVLGMVLISKRSIKLSHLISKSSVQVLATLFYLSFSLLVGMVATVFMPTTIQLSHESGIDQEKLVWYYNGQDYGHDLHGLYLVVVVFFVLCFIIPFTFFTIFSRHLLRFRWVGKLKPFFDAYGGPFKDKWRFWFGLRLWVTAILSAISGALQGSDPHTMLIIHLQILSVFIVFQAYIRPFKSFLTGLLDIAYMINLFLLIELYLLGEDDFILCYKILLSFACFTLFLTLFYHVWCMKNKLAKPRLFKKLVNYGAIQDDNPDDLLINAADDHASN